MAAGKKALQDLHEALTLVLVEELKQKYDEEGNPLPRNAAILNVARQMLKDNGIEALEEYNKPLQQLAAVVLPFPPDEDGKAA